MIGGESPWKNTHSSGQVRLPQESTNSPNCSIAQKQLSESAMVQENFSRAGTPARDLIDKEFEFMSPKSPGFPKSPLEIYKANNPSNPNLQVKKKKKSLVKSGFSAKVDNFTDKNKTKSNVSPKKS